MKLKVPFYKQSNNDCILTCVKMVLEFHGKKFGLKNLHKLCNFGKHGCSILDVIGGLEKANVKSSYGNLSISELKKMIENKKPVICIINSLFLPWIKVFAFHSVVVVGYEDEKIVLIDPLSGEKRLDIFEFLDAWGIFNNLSVIVK
ncbi:MAG: C39 family peptidase [Candidatus Aenigmarchaeota archaeon]|nr:C39 family peptidase [Candidatus Aenigmarchaeota archaeon]